MPDGTDHAAILERIRIVTEATRTSWFTYLATLAFFAVDRGTDLPLIGVSVPVVFLFLFGGLIVLLVFAYLHVSLAQLWQALGRAPPRIGTEPLGAKVHPWLISEFALQVRRRLSPSEPSCVEQGALGTLGVLASAVVLYGAAPAVLAGLWYRSQPAHHWGLTVLLALMLALSLWTAWASWSALRQEMQQRRTSCARGAVTRNWLSLGALVILVGVSILRTKVDIWNYPPASSAGERGRAPPTLRMHAVEWFRPVPANLTEARLTQFPSDWAPHAHAEREFYAEWCARPDTSDCDSSLPQSGVFQEEWRSRRGAYLAVLQKPNLSARDLAFAELGNAYIPGIDFREARLRSAFLWAAELEGANLQHADLRGAILENARLQGADLSGARMSGANLDLALLHGAWAIVADLEGAKLRHAELNGTFLNGAELTGADLSFARLDGATLSFARLADANLNYARLFGAPGSPDLAYAYSEVDLIGATIDGAALRRVDLRSAALDPRNGLKNSFGDASVLLPAGVDVPCQWSDVVLPDADFFGRWRGWIEAGSDPLTSGTFAHGEWHEVEPVQPAPGCMWRD